MAELTQVVLDRLRKWTEEFELSGPPARIDARFVHKQLEQNVLVSRFEPVDEQNPDEFIAQLALDVDHPFFFEHDLDHIPGLMLIEAGRQLGTALAHIAFGVPLEGRVFVLNGVTVEFTGFSQKDRPVFVNSSVRKKKYRRGVLWEMLCEGHFVQNERPIGYMSGHWHMYPRAVVERTRRAAVGRAD